MLMVLSSDTCACLSPVWSANEAREWRSLGVGVNSHLGDRSHGALRHLRPVSQIEWSHRYIIRAEALMAVVWL